MSSLNPKFLLVKYSLEFFVVVLGISVSFWLSEWNEDRKLTEFNIEDTYDLLEDLAHDEERLDEVGNWIDEGKSNTFRIIENIELYRNGELTQEAYIDSIISVGYVYVFGTFFMNNSTYKTLLQNGRMQLFPDQIEEKVRDYYEYVSKRVDDNNHYLDEITINYYSKHHPYFFKTERQERQYGVLTEQEIKAFFEKDDMLNHYTGLDFYMANLHFNSRVVMHGRQIELYSSMRNEVDSLLRAHVGELIQ